jgi:sirohydrochlorin ferrochelatase
VTPAGTAPPPRAGGEVAGPGDPVVLVAHGSRDPRSARVNEAVARGLAGRLPGVRVDVAQLDHAGPRPDAAIDTLAALGHRVVRLQPLLFTPAYHVTVDLPEVVDRSAAVAAGAVRLVVQGPLVTHPALADALDQRLAEATADASVEWDALVLASAGTSDATARRLLHGLAARWAARHGVPALAAFASAAAPGPGEAVARLTADGHRVAVGSLFVGPGFLPDRARADALAAGAVTVAAPLADAPPLVDALVGRYEEATAPPVLTPAVAAREAAVPPGSPARPAAETSPP